MSAPRSEMLGLSVSDVWFSDYLIWEWWWGLVSLTKAVAIDCEMVGVGSDGSKSAIGRVTLVSMIFYFNFLVCLLCAVII